MARHASQLFDLQNAVCRHLLSLAPIQDYGRVGKAERTSGFRRPAHVFNKLVNGDWRFSHSPYLSRYVKFLQALTCYYFFAA